MAGLIPFNRNLGLSAPRYTSFYNMLDDFFSDPWPSMRSFQTDTFKVDVKEKDNAYDIEAELPGVQKDEISLAAEDGHFTIAVNRNEESEHENAGYIHRERRMSSMSRSLYLADADEKNVSAKLEDGVLKITIPKQTEAPAKRRIEIQ
jgi:HSP20 family protein